MNKQELINALDDLCECVDQINYLMDQDDDQTVNMPGVVEYYPFDISFDELPNKVSEWVDAYKEKLRTVSIELTKAQLDMVYNAVAHLNWEINESNEGGWLEYSGTDRLALESAEKYLLKKI